MKRNIILTAIFLVLILIFLLMSRSEKKSERAHIPDSVVAVDSTKVSKIEIKRQNDDSPVTLEKRGTEWHVTTPVDYPANQEHVGALLSKAANMQVMGLASSNPEKQSQFQVDSTGTFVKLYEGPKQAADFVIGKSGTGGVTFIRQSGSDNVYSVDGYLPSTFGKRVQDWRDKIITNFEKDQLTSLKLIQADEEMTITRNTINFEEWDLTHSGDSEVFFGNADQVTKAVNSLWRFNAQDFVDDPDSAAVAGFAIPDTTAIITLADNTIWTLHFEPQIGTPSRFLVKREDKGDGVYFVTNKGILTNIFADFEEFKGTPPPIPGPEMPPGVAAGSGAAPNFAPQVPVVSNPIIEKPAGDDKPETDESTE